MGGRAACSHGDEDGRLIRASAGLLSKSKIKLSSKLPGLIVMTGSSTPSKAHRDANGEQKLRKYNNGEQKLRKYKTIHDTPVIKQFPSNLK